jgi:TM2 domain-containing membrane protein YozV
MDQNEKDRIAAEIAADYRNTIRETADTERRIRSGIAGEKSLGLAYFFWFGFGGLGVHRFYLGYPLSGAGMLFLAIFAAMFSLLPFLSIFGYLLGVALMVWWLADAFLIPRLIPDY